MSYSRRHRSERARQRAPLDDRIVVLFLLQMDLSQTMVKLGEAAVAAGDEGAHAEAGGFGKGVRIMTLWA